MMISQERLKELVSYDIESGIFSSRHSRGCIAAGKLLDAAGSNGYVKFALDGRDYFAHRLAFLYQYASLTLHLGDCAAQPGDLPPKVPDAFAALAVSSFVIIAVSDQFGMPLCHRLGCVGNAQNGAEFYLSYR